MQAIQPLNERSATHIISYKSNSLLELTQFQSSSTILKNHYLMTSHLELVASTLSQPKDFEHQIKLFAFVFLEIQVTSLGSILWQPVEEYDKELHVIFNEENDRT